MGVVGATCFRLAVSSRMVTVSRLRTRGTLHEVSTSCSLISKHRPPVLDPGVARQPWNVTTKKDTPVRFSSEQIKSQFNSKLVLILRVR
jgi:hypothetical protein